MPKLGDYLGHLMSEITIARMQADLEAMRVAELYATHPLLRHFSVPRFRLPDVELDVPVVISEMEEPGPDDTGRGRVDLPLLQKVFHDLWTVHLRTEGVEVDREAAQEIEASVQRTVRNFARPPEIALDVNLLADALTRAVFDVIEKPGRREPLGDPSRLSVIKIALRDAARVEFLKRRTPPPRLNVLVTAAEIRDAGGAEGVIHIRMKLSEEGIEWTTISSDGEESDRLVPE